MLALSPSPDPGKRLRAKRVGLNLSTREVQRLSQRIVQERQDPAFYLSHNWITDLENGKFKLKPRLQKLYSLSLIYRCGIDEMFALFGLNVNDVGKERGLVALPHTPLFDPP